MTERTYGDIDWELEDIIDRDIDGSKTRLVSLRGYARCDEGGGHFEFEATAQQAYPYEEGCTEIEIDEEIFIPDDRAQKDAE